MCVAGNESMISFAKERGIAADRCGKLVVAVDESDLPQLQMLLGRAEANGVPARLIGPDEARDYEPEVACVAALRVESTGIVDYRGVPHVLLEDLAAKGAELRLGAEVTKITGSRGPAGPEVVVQAGGAELRADGLVNCAGLHSDRVARMAGLRPEARIVPFRGEYYELRPERSGLVRGLIYPVPDPQFPFLGVHLTRMVDGSVHAGPNAVIALRREGYRWRDISPPRPSRDAQLPGLPPPGPAALPRRRSRDGALFLPGQVRGQPGSAGPGADRGGHCPLGCGGAGPGPDPERRPSRRLPCSGRLATGPCAQRSIPRGDGCIRDCPSGSRRRRTGTGLSGHAQGPQGEYYMADYRPTVSTSWDPGDIDEPLERYMGSHARV